MKGRRLFRSQIFRTVAGRFRWVVSVRGETVAHGWAVSKMDARSQSLNRQRELLTDYQKRGCGTLKLLPFG